MSDCLDSCVAIVGFGDSYASEQDVKTPMKLAVEAASKAMKDAGLRRNQIDGLLTGRAPVADLRPQWNCILSSYMGFTPEFTTEVNAHSAGINGMFGVGAMALNSGLIDYCLCVQSDAVKLFGDAVFDIPTLDTDLEFEYPYGPSIPSIYAQVACRYMYEYGVTDDVFARVAVGAQKWGVHHPYAAKRDKGLITIADVLGSRRIADPIHLWNAAVWGPGGTGGAFILTTAERARDMTDNPIYVRGFGSCVTHEYITDRMTLRDARINLGPLPNLTHTGAARAAEKAYAMSGLGPSDIGSIQCSGNFTHVPMILLEDFGFAERGQAKDLILSGRLEPGGDLPFNTNGGWLSFGQPGVVCAMDSIVEAIRQLRGEALGLQIEDPGHALVHSLGGMLACHSVTILSKTPRHQN